MIRDINEPMTAERLKEICDEGKGRRSGARSRKTLFDNSRGMR